MRILLDEAMPLGLVGVLTDLGQSADHISALGMSGLPDQEVVRIALDYDALLTLDLHRQRAEWRAVNRAMLAGLVVIRLRFRGSEVSSARNQAQALIRSWPEIERSMQERDDVRLIVVSNEGNRIRVRTVDAIRATLRDRAD